MRRRIGFAAGASNLIGVCIVEIHTRDVGGVEPDQFRICVHHVARIAARRQAGKIIVLEGAEDVGADAQPTSGRLHVVALPLARFAQYGAE